MSEDKKSKKMFKNFVVEEFKYKTLLTNKYANKKKYAHLNSKEIKAFIPGTIKKILLKKGKKVKEGDIILILDAMKMSNQIAAPFNGTIKKIYVKKGDMVSKNFIMVEME